VPAQSVSILCAERGTAAAAAAAPGVKDSLPLVAAAAAAAGARRCHLALRTRPGIDEDIQRRERGGSFLKTCRIMHLT